MKTAGADWRPATPLNALRAGGQLRASADASAFVMLSGGRGTIRIAAANSPYTVAAGPADPSKAHKAQTLLTASLGFLAGGPKEPPKAVLSTRSVSRLPEIVTPRNEPVLPDARDWRVSGLQAAEKEGQPISGKFELEDGKLQLSVYTMKGDKFSEVIVDHKTGKVAKSEPITGGEDLAAAQKQAQAMRKTKHALREAAARAEKANPGFHAVSVVPEVENGKARADVMLLKGNTSKSVDEQL